MFRLSRIAYQIVFGKRKLWKPIHFWGAKIIFLFAILDILAPKLEWYFLIISVSKFTLFRKCVQTILKISPLFRHCLTFPLYRINEFIKLWYWITTIASSYNLNLIELSGPFLHKIHILLILIARYVGYDHIWLFLDHLSINYDHFFIMSR